MLYYSIRDYSPTTHTHTHTPSQIHSLSVAEKEGDNPCRFAVGTGSVESWEQYYVLEAATAEKKEQWVQSIKEILKGQFELLKGECVCVVIGNELMFYTGPCY